MGTTTPVTNAEAEVTSQSTVPNRSSGVPKRFIGVWAMIEVPRGVSSPLA
jgi:hypothetical protein